MKKIYLSALALMIGAIGFAQFSNRSTVIQEGINADSRVTQIGAGQNQADQYQRNVGGLVEIYQEGFGNTATQTQNPLWLGNPTGIGTATNPSRGKDAIAKIKQVGDDNVATQTQTWDNEHAYATQIGNGNTSTQYQTGAENLANVKQNGDDNTATQNQHGRRVDAAISQNGTGNTATQTQNQTKKSDGKPVGSVQDEFARINQMGDNNTATQTQEGRGAGRDINTGNLVKITQNGNGNTATQNQSNPNTTNISPVIYVAQRNVAEIIQEGDNDMALQNQFGADGTMKIIQRNGELNYGEQFQDEGSMGETAFLRQDGFENTSYQYQYGTDNTSNVYQNGGYNLSTVTQRGSGNTNTVSQTRP